MTGDSVRFRAFVGDSSPNSEWRPKERRQDSLAVWFYGVESPIYGAEDGFCVTRPAAFAKRLGWRQCTGREAAAAGNGEAMRRFARLLRPGWEDLVILAAAAALFAVVAGGG